MDDELPTEPGVKALVFGRNDSGKSTYAIRYAERVLAENENGVCIVLAQKAKTERKPVRVSDSSISDRILYKWIQDRVSLIDACAKIHEFHGQPLELLIIEDFCDVLAPGSVQVNAAIALFSNAISVFPGCRLVVTLTPKTEIVGFRMLMTHFVNTCGDSYKVGIFPKSISLANEAIRRCLTDIAAEEQHPVGES